MAPRASLEQARLLEELAFSHDLVHGAASRATPPAVRAHLHRSAVTALDAREGLEAVTPLLDGA
jgi:hypothetical protein